MGNGHPKAGYARTENGTSDDTTDNREQAKTKKKKKDKKKKVKNKGPLQILVAGNAQSGKTTFINQLRLIHMGGFSEVYHEGVFKTLLSNTIYGLRELIDAADEMESIRFPDRTKRHIDFFREKNPFSMFDKATYRHALALWDSKSFQKVWNSRDTIPQFSIQHLDYCIEHLRRFTDTSASPTARDFLLARIRTSGSTTLKIAFDGQSLEFFDVGGQRAERRHWPQVVQNPVAIIFFVALSSWNIPSMATSATSPIATTKLDDSIAVWRELVDIREFKHSFFIIMFNKVDLFEQKLKRMLFNQVYPDYEGDTRSVPDIVAYLRQQFISSLDDRRKHSIKSYTTCSLDTEQIKRVFSNIHLAITRFNLSTYGLL